MHTSIRRTPSIRSPMVRRSAHCRNSVTRGGRFGGRRNRSSPKSSARRSRRAIRARYTWPRTAGRLQASLSRLRRPLIDAGEFAKIKAANPVMSNTDLVRRLQRTFKMGIDCAGYVQLAFIHAYTGSDSDPPAVRKRLGLHEKHGWEKLASLPAAHFEKKPVLDAQTGDLFVFKPRAGDEDRAWHTVIVVDHAVSGSVHTFLCDASWGTELYLEPFGGVGRRELKFNADAGEWWDVHPGDGSDKYKNTTGPYNKHPIHGVFRPREVKAPVKEIESESEDDSVSESPDEDEAAALFGESELAVGELDPVAIDLAEKTMAHEAASFERQAPARRTRCLSKEDVAGVQDVYAENSSAGKSNEDDRCSCIVMLNVALGRLLGLKLKLHPARSARRPPRQSPSRADGEPHDRNHRKGDEPASRVRAWRPPR